jgi:ubiquinone/menaquinone biosynthesis C-methylase UbiE
MTIMTRRYDIELIKQLYQSGVNISEWVRNDEGSSDSSLTAILYSYDAQAGSYLDALQESKVASLKLQTGEKPASILDDLAPETLLDAGVGEATTLVPVIRAMKRRPPSIWGIDLSLSRLLFARQHLSKNEIEGVQLFTGSLDNLPMTTGSMDVVLTVHSVEPNRGRGKHVLRELLRVAKRYVVMIEPSYELEQRCD